MIGGEKARVSRERAEARFRQAKQANDEIKAHVEAERTATRTKSAGLKALRLAKEANEETPDASRRKGKKARTGRQ